MQDIRVCTMKRDENKLFLIGYKKDNKERHNFTICNINNKSKPVNVIVEKNHKDENLNNTIRCTCSDYVFRCYKNNIICKHCIFIIANGCKMDLSKSVKERKITKINRFNKRVKNIQVVQLVNDNDLFTIKSKELEDDDCCPICLDILKDTELKSCPKCKNYVHEECIDAWVRINIHCVYCRSDVWQSYKQ